MAATGSPITFIGTGEHMRDFEAFEPKKFVTKLMGGGDWGGFIDLVKDAVPPEEQQQALLDKITKGEFTLRIMYEQYQNIQKMGPMSQVGCAGSGRWGLLLPLLLCW